MTLAREPRSGHGAVRFSLGATLAIQITNVLTGVAIARALGVEGRGELTAMILGPTILATVGSLGVADACTFLASRGPYATRRITASALWLAMMQAGCLSAIGAVTLPLMLNDYSSEVTWAAVAFLAYIPLSLVALYMMSVANGLQRYGSFHVLRYLVIGIGAIPIVLLAAIGQLSIGVAAACYVAGNAVAALLAAVDLRRASALSRPRRDSKVVRELLSFGLRSHASTVPTFLNARVDQLAVLVVLPASMLGLYTVAVTMGLFVALVGFSLGMVALPTVAAAADHREMAARGRSLSTLTVVLALLIAVPCIAFAPELLGALFGDEFVPGANAARLILVASVVIAVNRVLEGTLKGAGRPLDAGLGELAGFSVMVVSLFATVPLLGLEGAAAASLLGAATSGGLLIWRTSTALDVTPWRLVVPSPADVRALAARLEGLRIRLAAHSRD